MGQPNLAETNPAGRGLLIWYRGGDSNPYSLWPLPPQGSVSTNSTTSAETFLLLLFRSSRYIACTLRRLGLLLKNRHIVSGRRFLLLLLQNCRIRQPDVLQSIRLFFSEVRQAKAGQEKNRCQYTSNPTQKGSGTLASENSCRSTCTERSPCIRTLAMLNEDQANKTQCHQQMHDNYDLFQHLQLPAARQIAPNSSALREAPPTSPPSISGMPNNSAALAAFTLPP